MSMCAVNMQKHGSGALGGLQSHNQREHESRKNKEIDPEKTHLNHDTVNAENINYQQRVKERIDGLNLKKAVRKDAVLYCSFIVSSDKEFFVSLGRREHIRRENQQTMVAIGLREPIDFDLCDPAYQAECIAKGSEPFFRDATRFFQRHFGAENVVNGNVHHDEPGAAHMHLGVVPVHEGRLSAKTLFTPTSLRQLQTDFANEVGAKYGLDRGKEGSTAKHLDELTFKLEQRKAELAEVEKKLDDANHENGSLGSLIQTAKQELQEARQELQEARESLTAVKDEVQGLRADKTALSEDVGVLERAYERVYAGAVGQFGKAEVDKQIAKEKRLALLDKFLEWPPGRAAWEKFLTMREMTRKFTKKRDNQPVL